MRQINWLIVKMLLDSHTFAHRVEVFYQDADLFKSMGLKRFVTKCMDCLGTSRVYDWKLQEDEPYTYLKEVMLAKDIVVASGYKLPRRDSSAYNFIWQSVVANDSFYSKRRKEARNDKYEFVGMHSSLNQGCCMPYDCMHYEAGDWEVWELVES